MLRTLTLLAAAVLLLGACAGPAASVAPTAAPATARPTTVSLVAGGYFVGPTGLTLYTFDKDSLGHSSCSGDCLAKWPALAVASTPEITVGPGLDLAEYTAIPRDDGIQQVTFKLIPLYYYGGDAAAGDTNGDGVGGIWHLAGPTSTLPSPASEVTQAPAASQAPTTGPAASCDPYYGDCEDMYTPRPRPSSAATPAASVLPGLDIVIYKAADGTYLVDVDDLALYTLDDDPPGVATCTGGCSETWPPLTIFEPLMNLVAGEGVTGTFALIERDDGPPQATYNGKPLYYYIDDRPGDTGGDGVGGVWHLAVP